MIKFKEWESGLVGFAMPFWWAFLAWAPGPWSDARTAFAIAAFAVSATVALSTLAGDVQGVMRRAADGFVVGLLSMAASALLFAAITARGGR